MSGLDYVNWPLELKDSRDDHSPTYIHPGLHLGLQKFLSLWRTPKPNYSRDWVLPKAQKLLKMSSYCNITKVAH